MPRQPLVDAGVGHVDPQGRDRNLVGLERMHVGAGETLSAAAAEISGLRRIAAAREDALFISGFRIFG